jgi:hypothetical protein
MISAYPDTKVFVRPNEILVSRVKIHQIHFALRFFRYGGVTQIGFASTPPKNPWKDESHQITFVSVKHSRRVLFNDWQAPQVGAVGMRV